MKLLITSVGSLVGKNILDVLEFPGEQSPGATMTVDLVEQSVTGPDGSQYDFSIDETRKERLVKGLDDVGVTLEYLPRIEAFEAQYRSRMPWLAGKI